MGIRDEVPQLTHAFLESHPQAAAKILEQLQPEDVGAFLTAAPSGLTGPVVASMIPWAAAQCLAAAAPDQAAAILRRMARRDATSVLRLIDKEHRQNILAALPERHARSLARSLRFPAGTVGASMEQGVPSLSSDQNVADALQAAGRSKGLVGSHLFVIDADRRLAGAVEFAALLRRDKTARLDQIMDREVRGLSSRASLASIFDDPAWDRFTALPVVGRKGNFLGVLSRQGLRRGLSEFDAGRATAPVSTGFASELFGAMFAVGGGLLKLLAPSVNAATVSSTQEARRDG